MVSLPHDTFSLRPKLSEALASFGNLPDELQMFVNIDVTDLFLEDPGGKIIFWGFWGNECFFRYIHWLCSQCFRGQRWTTEIQVCNFVSLHFQFATHGKLGQTIGTYQTCSKLDASCRRNECCTCVTILYLWSREQRDPGEKTTRLVVQCKI